jgi:hypothetical protein
MARFTALRIAAALLAGVAAMPAAAQGWHDHDRSAGRGHPWHGPELERWHHGAWWHGSHHGRLGWWWIVGDTWYLYPAPIYPYPDPYVPPLVGPPPPPPVAVAPPPAPPVYYYWCDRPRGYYPAVPACRVPWRAVPAAPPS